MKKRFGIKVLSESSGILPHTLRMWEQRYGAFAPERAENGQRLYSEKELIKAKLLGRLTKRGHSISKLASQSVDELELLHESHQLVVADPLLQKKSLIKDLFKYLSVYQLDLVANELKHLRMKVGTKDFIFSVVIPIMREIGILVSEGKYSVSQEHIISSLVRDQLSQMQLPNLGPKSTEMVLATPEGNLHELPIMIADILCRSNRFSTHYLGAGHPADCLAEALNELKSQYLVLGVVTSDLWSSERIVPFLEKLDEKLNVPVKILLGGGGNVKIPSLKNIIHIKSFAGLEEFNDYLMEGP